ncbi:MAG: 23S rRNA (adenine(2503)-C(2))-methyltransferase RlmN [Clostridia bacterium]|nr:23S rRNA (adenine(2503)-C(2))-methyltransferase RlmN [Clostridia bacterium]
MIKDFDRQDIYELVAEMGEPKYRSDQIFSWIYKGIHSFDEMTNIPVYIREALKEKYILNSARVLKILHSKIDDTTKFLFELKDKNIIESVLMNYKHGYTGCISTQVGCRMRCSFCASGIEGRIRNLTPGEMVDQVLMMQEQIHGKRISNVVLMGSGEPFDNYDNVIKFIRLINDEQGLNIGMRNITLSTCGLVEGILRLSQEGIPINLSISLHAPNDKLRNLLMPINKRYNIRGVLDSCKQYIDITHRRVTIEYILIKGVNDLKEHAHQLADLLKGGLFHVNLIPINSVKEKKFEKPGLESINRFQRILKAQGIVVTVRRELGSDIDAACGQLRRRHIKKPVNLLGVDIC